MLNLFSPSVTSVSKNFPVYSPLFFCSMVALNWYASVFLVSTFKSKVVSLPFETVIILCVPVILTAGDVSCAILTFIVVLPAAVLPSAACGSDKELFV